MRRVYWLEIFADNAISKAISGVENGYLLCECAMLCRAIGAVASGNDTAGFELPIPRVNARCRLDFDMTFHFDR